MSYLPSVFWFTSPSLLLVLVDPLLLATPWPGHPNLRVWCPSNQLQHDLNSEGRNHFWTYLQREEGTTTSHLQHGSTSHNPGPSNAPLAIEPTAPKGKGQTATSSTKSTKRKAIEGYGLHCSEHTSSSFIQTGDKRRVVSVGMSKAKAKASADGHASVIIETSAGRATSSARATINVTGGRATAKIASTSTTRGVQKK